MSKLKKYLNEKSYDIDDPSDLLTYYFKGEMPLNDLIKLSKKYGKVATKEELEMFLKNEFIQNVMSKEHNVPVKDLIKKVKELLKVM